MSSNSLSSSVTRQRHDENSAFDGFKFGFNRSCGVDGSWFKTKTGNLVFIKTAPVAKLLPWQQH